MYVILRRYRLGKIVESRPSILLEDLDQLATRVELLRKETPKLNWDFILTDFPMLFEIRNPAAKPSTFTQLHVFAQLEA